MSGIGPSLPPHLLAKRKRQQEEESKDAPTAPPGATRSPSPSGSDGEKRRKVMGPAMPPAPLDERPSEPANAEDSDSSDDDGFGPALPPGDQVKSVFDEDDDNKARTGAQAVESKPQRDSWMTMAPKQDDLAARMDPSKQRARGFNTGKGAKGANNMDDDGSAWNETIEQKQKRLQDEMMGITRPTAGPPRKTDDAARGARDEAAAARIREQTEKTRGPSLMEKHSGTKAAEQDDDPSKRAFDREKDVGSGGQISQTQRKQMLNKAADFSSKFAGGKYL